MCFAVARATGSPSSFATSSRARSIPAEMPADVSTLPTSTTCFSRSTLTSGNAAARRSRLRQCVVAGLPASTPATPSRNDPVHTDVTHFAPAACDFTHATTAGLLTCSRVPHPPGTTSTSSGGQLAKSQSGSTRIPPVQVTGASVSATSFTSNGHGSARSRGSFNRVTLNTSNGPPKSSTSTSGKIRMPMRVMVAPVVVPCATLYP